MSEPQQSSLSSTSSGHQQAPQQTEKKKAGRKRKRVVEHGSSSEEEDETKLLKIEIPPSLRQQLVTDWEEITQNKKLVPLPRQPNIDSVLEDFVQARKLMRLSGGVSSPSSASSALESMSAEEEFELYREVATGLKEYFNGSIAKVLLYKPEKEQHAKYFGGSGHRRAPNPSEIYGTEHLLRLFVKLPQLLAHSQMEDEVAKLLQTKIGEFLKFLADNANAYLLGSY